MPAPTPPSVERRSRGPGFAALGGLAIWFGFAGLLQLPNDWWSIRVVGLSLDWWYGGVIAPLLIIGLVLSCADDPPTEPLASSEAPSTRDAERSDHMR